ncbi:MAG: aldose epimerase family protein [Eubacteriales bacterium]|nr:aldose epimerase family protein [Eubacteriales bacterium]
MVEKNFFCQLKDGRDVYSYRITNCHGEYAELLDYGASIHAVVVRDKDGNLGDVVLGAGRDRLETCTYEGGTIGRCANRIAYGRYEANGKMIQLEQNCFGHFLHGAGGNYAHKLFHGEMREEENKVIFYWHDSGEGGFDCGADAAFSFSFDDEGNLALELTMTGEDTTVLNPTNHAYFNLSETGDARDHTLWIAANRRTSRGEAGLPDGGGISVENSPADFTKERTIREAMSSDPDGYFQKAVPSYDEFYLMDGRKWRHAATLRCPANGRAMEVFTDMPCLVLFVSGDRRVEQGKDGRIYEGYCAVCLETGFVPNAVNCPEYDSPLFQKGETLTAKTTYHFFTEDRFA